MASDLPTLLAGIDSLLGRKNVYQTQINNWLGGAPKGGPSGDGTYPLTDGTGVTRMVPSPAAIAAFAGTRTAGPEFWGAIGDGRSHPAREHFATLAECQVVYPFAVSLAQEMDFLGWQAMVNEIGSFVCPFTIYKMCNGDPDSQQPLDWCAGRSDVDASFSTLDWRDMRAKTTDQHVFDNYDFRTPLGWLNSTIYDEAAGDIVYATFDQGAAIGIDHFDGTRPGDSPYYAFGHLINPPAGRYRVYIEGTITRGVSYHHGNLSPPYGYVNFSSHYGVDQGGWEGSGRYTQLTMNFDDTDPENTPAPFSGQFDIEVPENAPPGYVMFKGGGYMNVRVTRLDLMPFVPNCAILNHRDHAPEHYFMAKRFRRANILGPDPGTKEWVGLTCGLWKSFSSIDGDLQDWEQIRTYGWGISAELSDGAYLLHFYHCYLLGERCSIYFGPGNVNAGENIKLFGGNCSAGGWIIENPGSAEITLFGTATDYPGKGLCKDNAGLIRLIGTRHEQPIPGNDPIWHCTTGRVIYESCFILLAGVVNGSKVPLAQLDTTTSSLHLDKTQVYNMTSEPGMVASGAGRVTITNFLNTGNPNIGPDLLTEADSSDVLGGAGRFEAKPENEVGFINTDPTGIFIPGGLMSTAADRDIMIDRWNSETVKMSVSSEFSRSGLRSLKVQKLSGKDDNVASEIQFMVPLTAPGNMLGRMFLLFPNALNAADYPEASYPNGPLIYFRQFWAQVGGYDALGRPIISNRGPFKGENTIKVPMAGSTTWMKRQLSSLYEPATTATDRMDQSPAWATHYFIAIGIQSVGPMTFYMDDFLMNRIG